jgi:hypothetical protein
MNTTQNINKSSIMKRAWVIFRAGRIGLRKIYSFRWALVEAWKEAKAKIKPIVRECYYKMVNEAKKVAKPVTSYDWGNTDLTEYYRIGVYNGD